ncbi:hypothetical protein GH5_07933 [Leishmania sp. Ghana 2012 LV757]|uniref:hypothetical protein n=1 Tax=Leishmania sp. Ghana 2012 LV757 TaxID=2803181 RepID=UPI001B5FA5E2|nr:hypothetical protein GH5_07933 [Leishmania sp. Ghana 2012 LV757]
MYLRKPLVQRGVLRCRSHRCHQRMPAATRSAPLLSSGGIALGNDFACYAQAEFTDALFTTPSPSKADPCAVEQRLNSSLPLAPPASAAGAQRHHRRGSLHCGNEVSSTPPTHAILNHLNSSIWLQVLFCMHRRGALSGEDCAGAIRYLPAFTYRPLLPWLWPSTALSMPAEAAQPSNRSHRNEAGRSSEAESLSAAAGSAEGEVESEAQVYSNLPLAALAMSRRPASPPAPPEAVPLTTYAIADISTSAPAQWAGIATSVVRSTIANAPPATAKKLLKVWHSLFFALRSHVVWAGTPEQLRDCAHPQLMRVFKCFYADIQRHSQLFSPSETCDSGVVSSEELQLQHRCEDVIAEVEVRTLAPPILLRSLRSLYRPHRNSAMLFAELYAMCINEEEAFVHRRAVCASSHGNASAVEATQPITRTQRQRLATTALLMDVDLAAYYATLPGRRHSGLSNAAEQWAVTLQHLRFLLPRVHLLQQCVRAQRVSLAPPKRIDDAAVWQPWRQVASILMNVSVWVRNDNAEAERCVDALRCTVETLRGMRAQSSTAGGGDAHKLLAPPSSRDVCSFISCLVEAARDSMRAKAAQLQYGPTDGLFGVYLLSVAVASVVPASAVSHKSTADCQQTSNGVSSPSADAVDAAEELLERLRLLFHASKSTPREVWAALRRSPMAGEAARYGLVTVGYRLFSDCVMPLASQPKTIMTAWRLWGRLRVWATEVGRPLGLRGEAVSALWRLRWLQEQDRASSMLRPRFTTDNDNRAASALLCRLTSGHVKVSGDGGAPHDTTQLCPVLWRCGCGFENECTGTSAHHFEASSVACAACVLRTLTPLCWECPSCHAVANSGVCVPYCLCCEEAHPLADQLRVAVEAPDASVAQTCRVTSCERHPHVGTATLLRQRNLSKGPLNFTLSPPSSPSASEAASGVVRCCWDCGQVCGSAPVDVDETDVELHPSSFAPQSRDRKDDAEPNSLCGDGDSPKVEDAGALVYVCSACHSISAGPHSADSVSLADSAPATEPDAACCSICGSTEPGYYTAAFTWACSCGACNSALHAYCHACSRAAQQPAVTCAHCGHAQPVKGAVAGAGNGDECEHCHHPHPRVLAAIHQHRLVRCPACQGLVLSTSLQCPHCACTAVAAVAALLPTEADQPWLCHHCGSAHAIRSSKDGQLRPPAHLTDFSSLLAPLPLLTQAEDGCCATCGTRRLPATEWERGRLWGCRECGEPHNSELSCRRCSTLAPGVPAGEVYVWRCAACDAYHPSWETHCHTAGCGGRRAVGAVCRRFCYSPWTCAECGEVTLSSHATACASCGTEAPAPLRATPCIYGDTCATTAIAVAAANAERCREHTEANGSAHAHPQITTTAVNGRGDCVAPVTFGGTCATLSPSLAHPLRVVPSQYAATAPASRLAEVEALLLQAAAHPNPPLLAGPLLTALVEAEPPTPLWPHRSGDSSAKASEPTSYSSMPVTDPTRHNGTAVGDATGVTILTPEPWEEAYAAMVISF